MERLNDAAGEVLRKVDELKTLLGADRALDMITRAMSNDDLEDILRFIYRMIDMDYDEEISLDIDDELVVPTKVDNTLTGEGKIAFARPVLYRDFLIFKTTDGLYDVYDRVMTIYGVRYKTVDDAKKDIDKYIEKYGTPKPDRLAPEEEDEDEEDEETEEKVVEKEFKPGTTFIKPDGRPLIKAGYKIQKYSDGRIVVTLGGEANKEMGRQLTFTEFETPQEVLEYLLSQKK